MDWRLLLGSALPLAVALLSLVSLRWEFADGHPPAYGFPLPWTWRAGGLPAAWQLDPLALLVDACVYLASALALSLLAARLVPPPRSAPGRWGRLALRGALGLLGAALLVLEFGAPLAEGRLRPGVGPRGEMQARHLWVGLLPPD